MPRNEANRHRPGYQDEYNREVYDNLRIRVRKDSGLKNAIRIYASRNNMSVNEYVIEAVQDRLAFDGYIPGEE